MNDERLATLERNLAGVRARIDAACERAGRDRAGVTLIAISKTWPASDVLLLHRLGVNDFGENYDRDAAAKAGALAAAGVTPRWHFVGQAQRNKCTSIASYADVVHSVDRVELAAALSAGARRAGRVVGALVQVSFDADPARGGVAPGAVDSVADAIAHAGALRLDGVMAVAPLGAEPRACFAALRAVSERLRDRYPEARVVSAGMSGDLEEAIAEGATHVRVGTALFGERGKVVG